MKEEGKQKGIMTLEEEGHMNIAEFTDKEKVNFILYAFNCSIRK